MPEIICLGPVNPREIPEIIQEIRTEGNHFRPVPSMPGKWPKDTTKPETQLPPPEDGCTDGS